MRTIPCNLHDILPQNLRPSIINNINDMRIDFFFLPHVCMYLLTSQESPGVAGERASGGSLSSLLVSIPYKVFAVVYVLWLSCDGG